jgi:hypothetical protein
MTVDRTHILATPGLDRHSAYVALSRHREGVQLHYGRDDFANQGTLIRTLSRERIKDMASDYARDEAPTPQPRRSIFAGFRPNPERAAPAARMARSALGDSPEPRSDLSSSITRHARARLAVDKMHERGIAPLPHQVAESDRSLKRVEHARPGAARDLAITFDRQPELVSEAASGRTGAAIRAMQLEADIRRNPNLRAERFVADWQKLHRHKLNLDKAGDYDKAQRIGAQMNGVAKALERDPQVESLLRNRTRELGIKHSPGASISRDLADSIGFGRRHNLGLGR